MLTCVRNELSWKVWKTLGNHRGSFHLHHCLSLPPKCLYGGSEGGTCKPAYCVNLRICWPCIIFILHNKKMQADTGTNGPGYIFIALLLYHLAYEEFGVWGGFCLQRPSWEGFFFFFKPGQTCSCLVLQNPNCTVLDVDDAVLSGL